MGGVNIHTPHSARLAQVFLKGRGGCHLSTMEGQSCWGSQKPEDQGVSFPSTPNRHKLGDWCQGGVPGKVVRLGSKKATGLRAAQTQGKIQGILGHLLGPPRVTKLVAEQVS